MKKLLSLSLMLSLGLATVTPALNAAQSQQAVAESQANPAHVSGWQAAKKWWRSGRNMKALNRQEQRAFNALKKKFTLGAIITAIVALVGGGAAYRYRRSAGGAANVSARPRFFGGDDGGGGGGGGPAVRPAPVVPGFLEQEFVDAVERNDEATIERLIAAALEKFMTMKKTFEKALGEYVRVVTNENYTQEELHHPSHYKQKQFRATLRAVRENKESAFISAYAEYKKAIETFQTFLDEYPDPNTEQILNNALSGLESNAITFLKKNNFYRNPLLHYDLRTGNLVSVA